VIEDSYLKQDLSDGVLLVLVAASEGFMNKTCGTNVNATDIAVANIVGTIGILFWINRN